VRGGQSFTDCEVWSRAGDECGEKESGWEKTSSKKNSLTNVVRRKKKKRRVGGGFTREGKKLWHLRGEKEMRTKENNGKINPEGGESKELKKKGKLLR